MREISDQVQAAARVIYRYMVAQNALYRDGELHRMPFNIGYHLKLGARVFGGICVNLQASPVITSDAKHGEFLAALKGNVVGLDHLSTEEMDALRAWVLRGEGELPKPLTYSCGFSLCVPPSARAADPRGSPGPKS